MCARYSLTKEEIKILIGEIEVIINIGARYNIAPTQIVPTIVRSPKGYEVKEMSWGFKTPWSKQPLINAKSETITSTSTFKSCLHQRCLIPADGFYEWQDTGGPRKQAWFIHCKDDRLFAFGGIWEHWTSPEGSELESAAMLTAAPSLPLATIHDRSPVVIAEKDFDRWLSREEKVEDLLRPPPDDFWQMEKVVSPRSRAAAPIEAPPPKPQMDLL